jgi:hypothetical protein
MVFGGQRLSSGESKGQRHCGRWEKWKLVAGVNRPWMQIATPACLWRYYDFGQPSIASVIINMEVQYCQWGKRRDKEGAEGIGRCHVVSGGSWLEVHRTSGTPKWRAGAHFDF